MGNVTVTVNNSTNSTNVTNTRGRGSNGGGKGSIFPPLRARQELSAIDAQMSFLLVLILAALTVNILMTILLQKKFKTLPYVMMQNIVAADLVTPILNGPLFMVGLLLDQYGIIIANLCNVQGFFHAALSAVFLNTVSMVAISRCLAILKPDLYHKIFANKIIIRLLSVGLWSTSALICVPPLNYKGWGGYRRLEGTCWLAWNADNQDYMAYNFLVTIFTLGPAVVSSLFALKVVYSVRKVDAVAASQGEPPPYPGPIQDDPTSPQKVIQTARLNSEVFFIVGAQLVLYLLLWVPLTVMDWAFVKDWRMVNFKAVMAFIFMFIGRSLFNPIIYFAFSSDIRAEFVNLFIRCRCASSSIDENHIEL